MVSLETEIVSEQLEYLECIRNEIQKGMDSGFCCNHYLAEKISLLMKSLGIEKCDV